jgi:LAO/AO transport system kinase
MEIADIICINKADHPQAKGTAAEVRSILEIGHELDPEAPLPPIVMTRGDNGEGVEELKSKVEEHREFLRESGRIKERHLASIREFVLSWATNKMEKDMQDRLSREDTELPSS